MKPHILFLIFSILQNVILYGQVNHRKSFQVVLEHDEVGKEISFGRSKQNNYDSLVLVYLGDIKTKKGQYLKILTSRWYWGLSPRATNRTIVFNQKNQYLGDYYLTMTHDVPDKIEESSLVFINNNESDCTPSLITKVSFKMGIPKKFFLKCRGHSGDNYSFAQNL
ncbi:MAG: uncharacterized protein JWR72_4041 [Flavisolibacter sp.]|jgi:hypothetical protein|nr:uncharacterized protein [Flavisolibacter sp.]